LVAVCGVGLVAPAAAVAAPRPFVPTPAVSVTTGPASTYHPVTVFSAYHSAGRISAGHPVTVAVAGTHGIPAAGHVNGLALIVTVSHATTATSASVSASGAPIATRVVTAPAARTASGFTVAALSATGTLRLRLAKGRADLSVDVEGYQSAGRSGETFHPLAPATVLSPHRVGAGATRRLTVIGAPSTGLPPNGTVAAVALAITVARPSATTTVEAYPRGGPSSTLPSVTAHRGETTSGVGIVAVGSTGDVTLRNSRGHATLSAQVEGYWTTDPTGSSYRSVTPTVLYDGTTVAHAWRSVRVAGRGGLPSASHVTAAVLSISTGTPSSAAYLAVAPTRHGFPASGPVSVPAHLGVTATVLARLDTSDVRIYANRRVHLSVTVVGWYSRTATGTDISAGACDSGFSTGVGFAVIRATAGQPYHSPKAACFAAETLWAKGLPAAPQFYLNLADPGTASSGHWNAGGPKACDTTHDYDTGCAYDYGYEAARQAVAFAAGNGMTAGARWWVDVETGNSWGSDNIDVPGHRSANAADIHGALAYLSSHGFPGGVYTETVWWDAITGSPTSFSDVPVWGGGADTRANARANCKAVSITGGPALLTQWFTDIHDDHDLAC
jgi:hypothetical protein